MATREELVAATGCRYLVADRREKKRILDEFVAVTLRKDASERKETISDTVRHTEVEVERTTPNDATGRERS